MQNMNIGSEEYDTLMTRSEARQNMAPTVYLTDDQVEALGLAAARVGETMTLHASISITRVTSKEDSPDENKGPSVCVEFRMDAAEIVSANPTPTAALYGK